MDRINEIFSKLACGHYTMEFARDQIRELFNARPQPVNSSQIHLGGRPEQWVTRTDSQIDNEQEMRYQLARYQDFWEWFEDEYGETEKEVWDKFEKYEDETKIENDGKEEN